MSRLFRLLLLAWPKPFRERFGPELLEGWEHLWDEARAAGGVQPLVVLLRTGADALRAGIRERTSTRGWRMSGGGGVRQPAGGLSALLSDIAIDLRHSFRSFISAPGYPVAVVVTLALGIGANTALFSTAWGIFGRPLPFDHASELIRVDPVRPDFEPGMSGSAAMTMSVPEIQDLRTLPGLASVGEYHRMTFTLIAPGGPKLVEAGVVSASWFDLLGMRAAHGRVFTPAEDELGTDPVVMLGHDFWTEAFEGDPAVVGTTVRMNGEEHEVVGVLPAVPQFPDVNDIYLPISACPTRSDPEFAADRTSRMMTVYARLGGGTDVTTADAMLSAAGEGVAQRHPEAYRIEGGWTLGAVSLREELVREARPVVWPLIGVAGLLLLAACANAGGLALSRANRRIDSLRIRAAVGAGRGRLARQLLTETVVLGLAGGLVGLSVAWVGTDLLARFAADFTTRAQEIQLDAIPLIFALGLSAASGVAFGLAPLLVLRRTAAGGSGSTVTRGRRGRRAQRLLVGVQVAVAFAVLTGAGLLLRSFAEAAGTSVGFETESVITARFLGAQGRYPDATDLREMLDRVRDELRSDPRVVSTARAPWAPLAETHTHRDAVQVRSAAGESQAGVALIQALDPEYFEILGVEVLEGRLPGPQDSPGTEMVAVVNREFRDRYMEGVAAVGDVVAECSPERACGPEIRIVGVVEDIRPNGIEAGEHPQIFVGLDQTDAFASTLVARVTGDPEAALLRMIEVARDLDSELAVRNAGTLEAFRTEHLAPRRFVAILVLAFALVAGGLAFAGVFGVSSLAASARSRELGIRRVLGASEAGVEWLVLREGLGVALTGCAVGTVVALGTGGLLRGLLWGVAPWDPWTFAAAWILFPVTALFACRVPARRAARDDVRTILHAP